MPDPTTTTLSNGVVVKVGDPVPWKPGKVSRIINQRTMLVELDGGGDAYYALDGTYDGTWPSAPSIDIAKLAALAQSAPTVPAERLRVTDEMFARAKAAYTAFVEDVDDYQPWTGDTHGEALRHALAAALEALADGGK